MASSKQQAKGTRGRAKRAKPASYGDDVRQAVKRAKELRGQPYGAGPKQHQHIREIVTAELGGNVTKSGVVKASGFKSHRELVSVARGEGGRSATLPLRPLADKMGEDGWQKGRHLAAALAAWCEQL